MMDVSHSIPSWGEVTSSPEYASLGQDDKSKLRTRFSEKYGAIDTTAPQWSAVTASPEYKQLSDQNKILLQTRFATKYGVKKTKISDSNVFVDLGKRVYAGALEAATGVNKLLGLGAFKPTRDIFIKPGEAKAQELKKQTQTKGLVKNFAYNFAEGLGGLATTLPLDVMTGGVAKISAAGRVLPKVESILNELPDFAIGMGLRGTVKGAEEKPGVAGVPHAITSGAEQFASGLMYSKMGGGLLQIPKMAAWGGVEATTESLKNGKLPTKKEFSTGVANGAAFGLMFYTLPLIQKMTKIPQEKIAIAKLTNSLKTAVSENDLSKATSALDSLYQNKSVRPEVKQAINELTKPKEQRADVERRKQIDEMSPEEMKKALLTDHLTGLRNKRAYEGDKTPGHKVFIDVDNLKFINDTGGHKTGDELLQTVGSAIKKHAADGYRVSGDEFIINVKNKDEGEKVISKVNSTLSDAEITFKADGKTYKYKPTISHGIADTEKEADRKMLQHKQEKLNQGLRSPRGEKPPGLVEVAPEGRKTESVPEKLSKAVGKPGQVETLKQGGITGEKEQIQQIVNDSVKQKADLAAQLHKAGHTEIAAKYRADAEENGKKLKAEDGVTTEKAVDEALGKGNGANEKPKQSWEMTKEEFKGRATKRIEEPGIKRASFEKPQGIYTTPAENISPHKDLGGETYYWLRNPNARVLEVDTTDSVKTNRGSLVGQPAGIAALRGFIGGPEFVRLTDMSKSELKEFLSKKYTGIKWDKYSDAHEMLETYGGLLAKKKGYDAIYGVDKKAPEFTEYVGLTEKSMIPTKSHKEIIQKALTENKPVPREVLEEYKGEKWADEALKQTKGTNAEEKQQAGQEEKATEKTTAEKSQVEKKSPPLDMDGGELVDMDGIPMETNPDGTVTLYHHTSSDKAKKIRETGKFISLENKNETFFSNKKEGQGEGYGDTVIAVKIKPNKIRMNDAFHHGEIHVAVSNKFLSKKNILSENLGEKATKTYSNKHLRSVSKPGTGITVAEAHNEARSFLGKAHQRLVDTGKLRIHENSLPGEGTEIKNGKQTVGIYHNGTIHLDASKLNSGDASGILKHEGLHFLLRDDPFFIKKKAKILRDFSMFRGHNDAVTAAYKQVPKDTLPEHIDEEAAAYYLQNADNYKRPLFKRIISATRAFLMRKGIPLSNFTPDDLAALTSQGLRAFKKGRGFPVESVSLRSVKDKDLEDALGKIKKTFKDTSPLPSGTKPFLENIPDKIKTSGFAQFLKSVKEGVESIFVPEKIANKISPYVDPLLAHKIQQETYYRENYWKISENKRKWWKKIPESARLQYFFGLEEPAGEAMLKLAGGDMRVFSVLKDMAQQHRDLLDGIFKAEKANGININYIKDYWPHIWEDQEAAAIAFKEYSHSLGKDRFAKLRTVDKIRKGLALGLKLKTTNPEKMIAMRLDAGHRAIVRQQFIDELQEKGLAKLYEKDADTAGLEAYDAPDGHRYLIPKELYPLIVNAGFIQGEGKSLWLDESAIGKSYRTVMRGKNLFIPIKLGLSAFHVIHVATIDMAARRVSILGSILNKKLGWGAGLAELAKVSTGFTEVGSVRKGYDIIKAYGADPATLNDYQKQSLQYLMEGGQSTRMSEEWRIDAKEALDTALAEKNYVGIVGHGVRRILEGMQKPIFEVYVPSLKVASFLDAAERLIAARPELGNDLDARRVELRKIAKNIDDWYGELSYKTLFWNRLAKDTVVASTLSMGWQLGFIREFGGAAIDTAKFTKDLFKNNTKAEVTRKMLFALDYTIQSMVIGGLITWAMTKKPPEKALDYFYPKTGEKAPDGSDMRFNTPFYTREWCAIKSHIRKQGVIGGLLQTAKNKANPMIAPIFRMYENKDYYGVDIRDTHAPWYTQTKQMLEYAVSESLPISISSINKGMESMSAVKAIISSELGFTAAPRYITETPIQKKIFDEYSKYSNNSQTRQQADRSRIKRELRVEIIKTGKLEPQHLYDAIKKGAFGINPRMIRMSIKRFIRTAKLTSDIRVFSALPAESQVYLLQEMNEKEYSKYYRYAKGSAKFQLIKLKR